MASSPLVELRDRLVARCALIVERHDNATVVPQADVIPSEMRQYVEPIIDRWLADGPPWRAPEVVGCTPDEIREIESAQQVVVPESVRAFLLLMGREAGDLNLGTAWLYPDMLDLKESALELLAEHDNPFAIQAVPAARYASWLDYLLGQEAYQHAP